MARLIADAGAEYIYKENSSNSSTPIGLETAYGLIQKADYWINVICACIGNQSCHITLGGRDVYKRQGFSFIFPINV